MTGIAEIVDAGSLARFLGERFGAVPGEEAGVLHVAAVWRPPGEDRHVVLRICDQTPRSDLDFLLLNLARARAEAIVTTGRILRQEPGVTHDLQGSPGVRRALGAWRRDVLGLAEPPWLLVLTSGRDLDPRHPAFRAWARPIILCPASSVTEVRGRTAGTRIQVAGTADPGIRAALDHLQAERGARRISIEAGPSTARAAYDDPARIDELLLSVFAAAAIPPAVAGGELPPRREIERILGPPRAAFTLDEPSGRWRYERYRRAILRARTTTGRAAEPGGIHRRDLTR
jgi:riboflavin biosynthesis pyrimidine reductase